MLKPWLKKEWVIPTGGAEFVWRMEDLLDLYAEPFDPTRPVVGFDSVDLQTLPADAEVPGAARRWFLMVFDMAFSDAGGIAVGREAAIDMFPLLHSSDLVAVATYRRTGVDIVIGFTSDRDQIREYVGR